MQKKKMTYRKLLSKDRILFLWKVCCEILNSALVNTSDRESGKAYFLQLVEGNEELSEIEKRYCREIFVYEFELSNARDKRGKPRECDKCQTIRYSDKFCE